MKRSLLYIFALILSIPSVFALEHSVAGDLNQFVQGISSLFHGNTNAFVDGLIGLLPLIGLFMIVFGLTFFLTRITVFRKDDQSKYAKMVAVGIALIGIVQQAVYNVVLGMSRTFLILAFIFLIVMMAIMYINISRRNHYDVLKETNDAKKAEIESTKAMKSAKDDLEKDKKYYTKTKSELAKLDADLKDMKKLGSDELKAVDRLIDLVTRAHSAVAEGSGDKIHKYAKTLNAGIAGLTTKMNHEHKHLHRLDHLLSDVQRITRRWGKDEKDEEDETKQLQKVYNYYNHLHGGGKLRKDLSKFKSDITGIKDNLREIHNGLQKARHLEHRLDEHKKKFDEHDIKKKHSLAEETRNAIADNDFKTAHSKLDNLRYTIQHQRQLFSELHDEEQELKRLFSFIEKHEREVMHQIKHLVTVESHVAGDEKDKINKKITKEIKGVANVIKTIVGATSPTDSLSRHLLNDANRLSGISDDSKVSKSEVTLLESVLSRLHELYKKKSELLENTYKTELSGRSLSRTISESDISKAHSFSLFYQNIKEKVEEIKKQFDKLNNL
ncbi:MAG: hypothetical protein ACQESC_01935 [Nanobdellota archaeon]